MRKVSLILSAAALSLQNSGARAASQDLVAWVPQPMAAPQPALVAILALVGMGVLVLMTRTPDEATLATPPASRFKWPNMLGVLPSHRAALTLFAMIAASSSLGMA